MTFKQFTEKFRRFKKSRQNYWNESSSLFSHLKVDGVITEEEYKKLISLRHAIDCKYYEIYEVLKRPAGSILLKDL